MAKKKPDRVCSDCIHFHACQSWTSGILDDTDAMPCKNYETKRFVDSDAYYLGQVDADKRNSPMKVKIKDTYVDGTGTFRCPNCQREMGDYYTRLSESYKYCKYCGQALDWRDD